MMTKISNFSASHPSIYYEDKVVKSLLATRNFFFFRVFFSTISNVTYHIASLVLQIEGALVYNRIRVTI
jgi:hypothetical protein